MWALAKRSYHLLAAYGTPACVGQTVTPEVINQLNKRKGIAVNKDRDLITNECESCALLNIKE